MEVGGASEVGVVVHRWRLYGEERRSTKHESQPSEIEQSKNQTRSNRTRERENNADVNNVI